MHDIAERVDPLPRVWDPETRIGDMLRGRRGLVVGIANEHSIAVSPGPLKTRSASGIAEFDELIEAAVSRAPAHRLVDIAEVGRAVAFLVGGGASGMTGDTIFIDAGLHIMG
jgi:enoyl-[acyl-carrier protein] reductase I